MMQKKGGLVAAYHPGAFVFLLSHDSFLSFSFSLSPPLLFFCFLFFSFSFWKTLDEVK